MGSEFMSVNIVMQGLLKKLLELDIKGIKSEVNFYDNPPSEKWLKLSDEEKKLKVFQEIRNFEVKNNLNQGSINFHQITNDLDKWPIRVIISLTKEVELGSRPKLLRFLEKSIRENLENTLQIFYQESKDQNKIRRL